MPAKRKPQEAVFRVHPARQKSPRGMISRDGVSRCTRLWCAKSPKLVELPPIPAPVVLEFRLLRQHARG
jgi:hypothetical protein